MSRVIPVGFGEITYNFDGPIGTGPFATTIGVSLIGLTPADYVDTANRAKLAYAQTFMSSTSDELTLTSVTLAVGLAGGVSGSVESDTPAVAGTASGTFMPVAAALIARKNTADLGRRGRGRSFLVGLLKEDMVDESGNVGQTTIDAYEELWDDLLLGFATPPIGSAFAPVLLHQDGTTPTPITSGSISQKIGWLRGRIR